MNTINTQVLGKESVRTLLTDSLLLGASFVIPAISHLLPFSLQGIEPMRWILLAGMLLVANRKNAYLLALLIPLFATLTTGFPMGVKCPLMMVEMLVNVALFQWIQNKTSNNFVSMLGSILAAKSVYYGLKYIVLGTMVMTIAWPSQLLLALVMSLAFAWGMKIRK